MVMLHVSASDSYKYTTCNSAGMGNSGAVAGDGFGRTHRFVELAQPSLEPHPVHVRHQLQPVLNLEHQRRERVVQRLGLVRSFQRRRVRASCARAARGGARVGAERRLEALLANAADEERHVAAIRLGTRRARRRMRASGGRKSSVSCQRVTATIARAFPLWCEPRLLLGLPSPSLAPARPSSRRGASGRARAGAEDALRQQRCAPPHARFPPPPPFRRASRPPRSRSRAPRDEQPATPADATSHRHPPEPDSTGSVVDRRTVWRPSILADMFWSVVNLIVAL